MTQNRSHQDPNPEEQLRFSVLDYAEKIVGGLLKAPDLIDTVEPLIHTRDFAYVPYLGMTYSTILRINKESQNVDLYVVAHDLDKYESSQAPDNGWVEYLKYIAKDASVGNLDKWAKLLHEDASKLRHAKAIKAVIGSRNGQTSDSLCAAVASGIECGEITVAQLDKAINAFQPTTTTQTHGTWLADVEPQPILWLWPGRIPLGKISLLDGDPGLGKSLVTIDLASRVSRGLNMPDGAVSGLKGPAGVVLISAEDDPADTIRPRLDAAGADVGRILHLTTIEEFNDEGERIVRQISFQDLDIIRKAIERAGAKLIIVDPLMAYLRGDTHRDNEVRQGLTPIAELAADMGVAFLVIRHLNKSGGGNPIYRGGGSIGIIGAARSGMIIAKDPEDDTGDRRVLACSKNNLSKEPPSLAYQILTPTDGSPRIEWLGEVSTSAQQLLAVPDEIEKKSARDEAKQWLREELRSGEVSSTELLSRSKKHGISGPTLRRAKSDLDVQATKSSISGIWHWRLPEKHQSDTE